MPSKPPRISTRARVNEEVQLRRRLAAAEAVDPVRQRLPAAKPQRLADISRNGSLGRAGVRHLPQAAGK